MASTSIVALLDETPQEGLRELSEAARLELKGFIEHLCHGSTPMQIASLEAIESGGFVTYVVKARLSDAADPRVANVTVCLVWTFDKRTSSPAQLISATLPDQRIIVRPWNWSRSISITGLDTFEGSWQLYRMIIDRVWAGVFAELLAKKFADPAS